jgi:hypothetical protein
MSTLLVLADANILVKDVVSYVLFDLAKGYLAGTAATVVPADVFSRNTGFSLVPDMATSDTSWSFCPAETWSMLNALACLATSPLDAYICPSFSKLCTASIAPAMAWLSPDLMAFSKVGVWSKEPRLM